MEKLCLSSSVLVISHIVTSFKDFYDSRIIRWILGDGIAMLIEQCTGHFSHCDVI